MGTGTAGRETYVRLLSLKRCEILYCARILAADCLTAWPLRGQWPAGPPLASEPCDQGMMES